MDVVCYRKLQQKLLKQRDERSKQWLKSGRMSRRTSMKRGGNRENMKKNPENDVRPVQQATDTKLKKVNAFKKTPYPGWGVLLGGGPRADPGHAKEIISVSWPGNASVFPRTSWRR